MATIASPNTEPVDPNERALIDQLIAATRLYNTSAAVQDLLNFTIRLREFAPFNAMLLHIQKPGLTHAATARDWMKRFGRAPKEDARPLLILRAMGPVDFVFDILDTEGRDVPPDAFVFPTIGDMTRATVLMNLRKFSEGSASLSRNSMREIGTLVGFSCLRPRRRARARTCRCLPSTATIPLLTRFVTVAHELAHL